MTKTKKDTGITNKQVVRKIDSILNTGLNRDKILSDKELKVEAREVYEKLLKFPPEELELYIHHLEVNIGLVGIILSNKAIDLICLK